MASDRCLSQGELVGNGLGRESRERQGENLPLAIREDLEVDAATLALFHRSLIHRYIISAVRAKVIH
jgi:hypothetical protein